MESVNDDSVIFLIDGFPRAVDQGVAFEESVIFIFSPSCVCDSGEMCARCLFMLLRFL